MDRLETYKRNLKSVSHGDMQTYDSQYILYSLVEGICDEFDLSEDIPLRKYTMQYSAFGRDSALRSFIRTGDPRMDEIYWRYRLLEAKNYQVDSGLIYLEKDRRPKERFYEPRRDVFRKFEIVQSLQALIDDELDFLAVALPPGTGKSTIEIFFLSLVGGWWPNDFNLSSAHSSMLTRSLYDGICEIIDDDVEYKWHDIFPAVTLQAKNAKETTINLAKPGRFKTWTMRSIDGSLTGATRCNRFETADDLVSGIEEALNKRRLDGLWTKVVNDLRSRRLDGCKEIFFNTRWSNHDPQGRLETMFAGNPRAKFIAVPALNENGESNFQYRYNGFSAEYFLEQREAMDEVSFNCLYQQKPVEREGLLFPADRLNRFFFSEDEVPAGYDEPYKLIPDRDPDGIWAVCDTKDKGTDYEAMPFAYQYGEEFYIVSVIFDDNTDYDALDQKTADEIIAHNPHKVRFESNQAGGRIAHNIENLIRGKARTQIETKYTETNKETKILANSAWIIKYCYFLAPCLYRPKEDYGLFMGNLCTYTTRGKVMHDDAPDVMAMLAEYVNVGETIIRSRIVKSPLSRRR